MTSKNLLVLLFFLLGSFGSYAGEEKKSEIASTIKEIFVKGSINNDHLFMVLGFEDSSKFAKDAIKNAIDIEDLKDLGSDTVRTFQRTGRAVYNRDHDGDVIDNVRDAAKFSVESAPKIFQSPWKSLKKIPTAHKVSMQQAREARANASNAAAGLVKYSGLAVWANVKGAYYLVIEAPTRFVANLAATVLAVPATLAAETIGIPLAFTIGIGMKVIRLGWIATKAVVAGAASIGALAYSGITTTLAAGATLLATGTINAVKITLKVISLPFKMGQRARLKVKTEVNYKKLVALVDKLKEANQEDLKKLGLSLELISSKGDDYRQKVRFVSEKTKKVGMELLITPFKHTVDKDEQMTVVKGHIKSKHYKAMKKELNMEDEALKTYLRSIMEKVILDATEALNA